MKMRRLLALSFAAIALAARVSSAPPDAPATVLVDPDSSDPEIANVRKTGFDAINRLGYMMVQEINSAVRKSGADVAIDVAHLKHIPKTNGRINGLPNITSFKLTSLKIRALDNKADAAELLALQRFQDDLNSGRMPPQVMVQRIDLPNAAREWRVYSPFVMQPVCVQCHGDSEELAASVREKLEKLYPVDQATGYRANEWRGMLRVTVDLTPPPEPKPTTPAKPATPPATKSAPKKK